MGNNLTKRLMVEPPSYVLDEAVAMAVDVQLPTPPAYTASIDRARELVPQKFTFGCGDFGEEDEPWACVTSPDGIDYACKNAATPAMALCVAALLARGVR